MPIKKVGTDEDYILYNVLCDYCDKEYVIKYSGEDDPIIECCSFCSNLIEELEGTFHDDDEDSWN